MSASYGTRLRGHRHALPAAALRRFQHGIGDVVGGEGVAERRRDTGSARSGFEEIGELMDERVLVANLQTGDPPMLHIRMIAVGDVHAPPAAQRTRVAVVEPLEPMEIVQIPTRRSLLTVDFE